jgi:hypothetical protein
MKFVLVNGRTPRSHSFCAVCNDRINELPAGRRHKPHLLRLPMLRRAPGWHGCDNSRLCEGIMITTGATVCGPNRLKPL